MRGTVGFGVGRTPQAGITPAHAGNSPQNNTLSLGLEDHPRSCGEQLEHHCFTLLTTGSPPLMRGTVLITQQLAGGPRITPAHAGNSQFPPSRPLSCRDHPRSCGEQTYNITYLGLDQGSPPLMRGTVAEQLSSIDPLRITPAHAGNSGVCQGCLRIPRDHPRSCGEQPTVYTAEDYQIGSPPLMRGTDLSRGGDIMYTGITPAHAGNSLPGSALPSPSQDHPRSCGEQLPARHMQNTSTGSPPPMRGTVYPLDVSNKLRIV